MHHYCVGLFFCCAVFLSFSIFRFFFFFFCIFSKKSRYQSHSSLQMDHDATKPPTVALSLSLSVPGPVPGTVELAQNRDCGSKSLCKIFAEEARARKQQRLKSTHGTQVLTKVDIDSTKYKATRSCTVFDNVPCACCRYTMMQCYPRPHRHYSSLSIPTYWPVCEPAWPYCTRTVWTPTAWTPNPSGSFNLNP